MPRVTSLINPDETHPRKAKDVLGQTIVSNGPLGRAKAAPVPGDGPQNWSWGVVAASQSSSPSPGLPSLTPAA